jgi:prepilin-type processing-associated H-X9-DG protein
MTARTSLSCRHRGLLLAAAVLTVAVPAVVLVADEPKGPALPADLAVVPRDAAGFAHLRVAQLFDSEQGQALWKLFQQSNAENIARAEKEAGFKFADVESATAIYPTLTDEKSLESAVLVVNFRKPFKKDELVKALTKGEDDREGLPPGFYKSKEPAGATVHIAGDRRFTVFTSEQARHEYFGLVLKRSASGPLDEALALTAGPHHLVVGVRPAGLRHLVPDADVPPPIRDVLPILDAQQVTATASTAKELKLDLRVRYADKGDAAKAEKGAKAFLELAKTGINIGLQQIPKDQLKERQALEALDAGLKALTLERKDDTVQVAFGMDVAGPIALLTEAFGKTRMAAGRMRSSNNLKQIGLAFHNYESSYGTFPPAAICDKSGKPLLSWRVAILPYIEQDNLYKQFRLNEPWDSEHNKKLLAMMPPTYVADPDTMKKMPAPAEGGDGIPANQKTVYRVFVGGGAAFDLRKGVSIVDFTDGTSNTILVVEGGAGVPWTKPEDYPFDPKKPLPKLGGIFEKGFNAAFADGSVRFISESVKPEAMKGFITRAGGEVIDQ